MSYLGRKSGRAALISDDIPDNSITSAKIVAGTVAASDVAADVATQAELDAVSTTVTANESDADKIQTNIALLAFKTAVNGSLAKYNLQDQVIDEYTNATGIDDTPSTNHTLASGVYSSSSGTGTPATHNANSTGTDGDYIWYKWSSATASGSFTVGYAQNIEYLLIAGGGGGGMATDFGGTGAGGGGAGGYLEKAVHAVTAQTYAIVIGAGGAGGTGHNDGNAGNNSTAFGGTTAGGGFGAGGGSGSTANSGGDGGSGGGGGFSTGTANGGTGNQGHSSGGTGYGNNGGAGGNQPEIEGGGGGAGGTGNDGGTSGTSGDGGVGRANDITGSSVYYAGGGGGYKADGGNGGGGAGAINDSSNGTNGTDGLGGGGGGGGPGDSQVGGDGGDGGLIVRRDASNDLAFNNLILQSTDTEAEAQPTKADMVMLIEDAGSGVGTVNTHIKGHISRDSGTTFTEGVLVDEGDWGTDKRILAFHDLDISGQPADQTMCYKITTHSASAVYNTKIHATSIGWR